MLISFSGRKHFFYFEWFLSEILACPSAYILGSRPFAAGFLGPPHKSPPAPWESPRPLSCGAVDFKSASNQASLGLTQPRAHTLCACGHAWPWCDLKFSASWLGHVFLREYLLSRTSAPVECSPGLSYKAFIQEEKMRAFALPAPALTCVLGSVSLFCTKTNSSCLCTPRAFVHSTPILFCFY